MMGEEMHEACQLRYGAIPKRRRYLLQRDLKEETVLLLAVEFRRRRERTAGSGALRKEKEMWKY